MILIWMLKDKRENTNLREYCRSALNHHSLTLKLTDHEIMSDKQLIKCLNIVTRAYAFAQL